MSNKAYEELIYDVKTCEKAVLDRFAATEAFRGLRFLQLLHAISPGCRGEIRMTHGMMPLDYSLTSYNPSLVGQSHGPYAVHRALSLIVG